MKRFEEDPINYRPSGEGSHRLPISAELVAEYREWMISVKRNSRRWSLTCERLLIEWAEDFAGRDLRSVKLHELESLLDKRVSSRKHRIEALKAFCKWLRRRKGLLTIGQDPTVDLPVPQSDESLKSKAIPEKDVSAVLRYLPEDARDVLIVLMGTGAHMSEIARFAQEGEFIVTSPTKATMFMMHKRKRIRPFPLRGRVYVEAAKRVKARGRIPAYDTLNIDMRAACAAAGVPRFTMGVIRHSFLTNAFKRGATMAEAGDAVHHSTPKTTKGHYVIGIEPKPVPPLRVLPGGG